MSGFKIAENRVKKLTGAGIPGWLSGSVPAFSLGCDPGVLGSSPTLGSLQEICFFAYVSASLCVSLMNK